MKKFVLSGALALGLVCVLALSGCGTKKSASGKEAIKTANSMETLEQKTSYLIKQAKAFYNAREFQEAVNIAQHILTYLDKDSQAARDLLDKARNQLAAAVKGAAEDAKKGLSGFGK
jgi:uncharacterized lipoprotein YehR (DUF1307 family)